MELVAIMKVGLDTAHNAQYSLEKWESMQIFHDLQMLYVSLPHSTPSYLRSLRWIEQQSLDQQSWM